MKHILIIGAGRSSAALIAYLSQEGSKKQWQITVTDSVPDIVEAYASKYPNVTATLADIFDAPVGSKLLQPADLVISMLPARLHIHIAMACLELGKPLLTASYIDEAIRKLAPQIADKGLTFLYECGLDPGIDHMSAMQMIDSIHEKGGKIRSFQSFCGGLMAPGSDDNPWQYKFTWNPRNVVLAGRGTVAQYLYKGQYKNIPHHQLFKRTTKIDIPGYGAFEAYPNRDSLHYQGLYGLGEATTILRGTLRRPGFCAAWHTLVQLGLTDDSYQVYHVEQMTYAEFLQTYLPYSEDDVVTNFCQYTGIDILSDTVQKMRWLGLFDDAPIGLAQATPADVVQQLLESKWKADIQDQDMIVMQHQLMYEVDGKEQQTISSLITTGESGLTGMAKTVGYPLGIAAKLVLENSITTKGLLIPTIREIYQPVMKELETLGIRFSDQK